MDDTERIAWLVPENDIATDGVVDALREAGYEMEYKKGGQLLSRTSIEIHRPLDTATDRTE